MGTLTLTQLKGEARTHLGGSTRTDVDDRLTIAFNIAQIQLARLHDFEELRQVSSFSVPYTGDDTADRYILYSVLSNSDPREFYSIRLNDDNRGRKLEYIETRQMDKRVPDTEWWANDTPAIYTLWNDRVELWPIPEKEYGGLWRFSTWPTDFSDSSPTATSDFRQKDDILIHLAVSYLYHSLGEYERAKMFYGIAAKNIEPAVMEDAQRPDQDIKPAFEMAEYTGQYWLNPFIKGVHGG